MINPTLEQFTTDIESLVPDPDNPRGHDDRNLEVIMESLKTYGQQTPIVFVERNGSRVVIKGNGTLESAKRLGWKTIAAIPFDKLDDLSIRGYKVTDNRSSDLSNWVPPVLKIELENLSRGGADLLSLGWSEEEIKQMLTLDLESAEVEQRESDGTMLDKLSVTVAEPKTKLDKGDIRKLGHHVLVVADPVNDVKLWRGLLTDEMLFAPYPGPYVALTIKAKEKRVLLVQPDKFIAGMIVDRWEDVQK